MISIIRKIYLWVGILLVSTYSVFACINDAYTSRSETLWGSYYSNAFEINLITTVLVILFESYFIIRLFRLHNQNQTVKTERFFTLCMLFLWWFFISWVILFWGMLWDMFFGMFLLFFLTYYICISIYQVYLLVKKNIWTIDFKETFFLGILLLYITVICYIFFWWFSSYWIIWVILITIMILILFYSLFIVQSYRHRISTIILLIYLLLQLIPLCIKYFEASSIKTPQYRSTDTISLWGAR